MLPSQRRVEWDRKPFVLVENRIPIIKQCIPTAGQNRQISDPLGKIYPPTPRRFLDHELHSGLNSGYEQAKRPKGMRASGTKAPTTQ